MPAMTDNVSIGDKFAKASDRANRSIQIRPDALHLIATEGENALIASDAPIYIRGDGLMKPVVDALPAANGKTTKAARLTEIDADCMIDHLSRAASWVRYNVRKKEWTPTDPPSNVAKTILSRDGEWSFRRLAGVITAPTMRADGTILSEAGYDPSTKLLLLDPPALPSIPERPTKEHAAAALALLNGLLKEFPFTNEESRSVALSAILTVVVRGALAATPMHVTTAPVAGSGKSYIIDVAAALAVGDAAPVITAAKSDEETEKRLVAALLNGQAVISIDNVNGNLGGDLLCQMVERPIVGVRPLGVSKIVKIENRACVFATGNNIHLVGDMTRRVIVCALDPQTERPELRKFKSDPFAMVMADRGKYIAAALTICRAYAVAGYPDQCRPLASFGDWSKVVRSALVWLGCADPVITMEAARAEDPEISDLKTLLHAWHGVVGSSRVSCADIINRSAEQAFGTGNYSYPELRQALKDVAEDRKGEISPRRLGKYLAAKKGRIVDCLRFAETDDGHANVKVWFIQEQSA